MGAEATLKMILIGEDRSAGKTLRGAAKDAETGSDKFRGFAKAAGVALTGGLITAGAAMVKFGDQASDLAETQSKVNQIFGAEGARALDKFADTAAKNLGQSKQQALDAASTFAIFGKGANLAGKDLVDFSTDMTTLASDLASFHNASPEEAIEAIGSALRGEAEPIRRFGVLLDDATLRNEALKLGLIKTTKEALTPQQKVLAAQAAIMNQTKDAQGDFARTSDGLANKQRILKAELSNMTTELGAKALPVMLKFVTGLKDTAEWVDENRATVIPLIGVLGGLAAAVVTVNAAVRAYTATQQAAGVVMGNKAAFAAGAAGIALIGDSARRGSSDLGLLESSAGGALSGAALGAFAGPPGALIGASLGGLAGLTLGLARATDDAGESAKVSLPSWKEYRTTLDGVSASTTKATREMVYQRLETSGLFKATRELGLTDREAVAAMTGNANQRQRLATLLAQNTTLTKEQRNALIKETGSVAHARLKQLEHNVAIAESGKELNDATTALKKFKKEPKHFRFSIAGVEQASHQMSVLLGYFRDLKAAQKSTGLQPVSSGAGVADLLGGGKRPGAMNAVGTVDWRGGGTWVGESGREWVDLPAGSRIYSAARSQAMVSSAGPGGGSTVVNVNFNGVVGDRRAAAREIADLLNDLGIATGVRVSV